MPIVHYKRIAMAFSYCALCWMTALALPASAAQIPALVPSLEQSHASRVIIERLTSDHYRRRAVDDDLSSELLDSYVGSLDPGRVHFTHQDMANLEAERYELDDALRRGSLDIAFQIFNLFQARRVARLEFWLEQIEQGLADADLDGEETLLLDRGAAPWQASKEGLQNLWRKHLLSIVISMRLDNESFAEIEEILSKKYKNRLRMALQIESADVFRIYMNALGATYDPHTHYYSPQAADDFDINMSLSLEGIGAILGIENEYVTVLRLIPGGPAEKDGRLQPADRILAVGQEDGGEMIDVVGWRINDVVQKIRGPRGTTVHLSVSGPDEPAGAARIIAIVRNWVELQDQSAKSEVLEYERDGRKHRIGVIALPTFYADFRGMRENPDNYRSSTRDVAALLEEFPADIAGVVIDLRDNGGGSLREANTLVGLFIPAGPTVQIRNAKSRINILNDSDNETTYGGPLVVLVNHLSASASEIFAGAIQDHGRGLIVGSKTFGKGTVQTLIPLEYGQLNITQAKFYRISGQSTQNQGILPDVQFPNLHNPQRVGEDTLDAALPRDSILPAVYHQHDGIAKALPRLQVAHDLRIRKDAHFAYLQARMERWKQQSGKNLLSLNQEIRRQEKAEADAWELAQSNLRRVAFGRAAASSLQELRAMESAEEHGERDVEPDQGGPEQQREKKLHGTPLGPGMPPSQDAAVTEDGAPQGTIVESPREKDALLWETGNILLDYIEVGV